MPKEACYNKASSRRRETKEDVVRVRWLAVGVVVGRSCRPDSLYTRPSSAQYSLCVVDRAIGPPREGGAIALRVSLGLPRVPSD